MATDLVTEAMELINRRIAEIVKSDTRRLRAEEYFELCQALQIGQQTIAARSCAVPLSSDDAPLRSKNLKQFAESHGLNAVTVRKLIVSGDLLARKAGPVTLITEADERAWLASLPLAVPVERRRRT